MEQTKPIVKAKGKGKGDKGNEPMPVSTGSGELVKMEIDYSVECDAKLPAAEKLAEEGKLEAALEQLLALEKSTRTGGDMISTGRVLVTVAQLCFKAKNWPVLNEYITLLSKRRGQLKQAVVKLVQEAMTYLEGDKLPTQELKYELIDTLRNVTEGKIYVEVERARLTLRLAKMKEAEGKITDAANILQDLQVETYGSMEKREKVELILEQMRYCLAKNDYIRTQIISKKINTKFFEEESTQDLKIIFYDRMIEMDQHEGSYLSICRHLRAKLDTPSVDAATKKKLHREAVLYLILSPFDNEQSDLLHRMLADKALEDIPTYRALLELFKNQELINWRELVARYEKELKAGSGPESPPTGVFDESALGVKRWQHLKDRVVEHNIRIMAKYYTKVTLTRMAQLLDLKTDEVEEVLCNMVVAGTVRGKTDRPAGIVSFQESKDPSELLNDWSHNLNSLMSLIARTTHLINKEEMVHKHLFIQSGEIGASQPPSDQNVAVPMEVEGN